MSHRQSVYQSGAGGGGGGGHARSQSTTLPSVNNRARQYAHLHAALAQLNAHLADTDNLLRMTAVQAQYMQGLGGWTGGLFMAAARVLGEDGGAAAANTTTTTTATGKQSAGDDESGITAAGDGRAGESSVFEQGPGAA